MVELCSCSNKNLWSNLLELENFDGIQTSLDQVLFEQQKIKLALFLKFDLM